MLDKLKESPSKKLLLIITSGALVSFIIITILFQLDNATVSALSPYGILHFEFAFTPAAAQAIVTNWAITIPSVTPIILNGIYLDFVYIAAYGLALMSANILIVRALSDHWWNFGIICGIAPIIAGILDIVENINLLTILNNPSGFPAFAPPVAAVCAGIKFGLLFLAIGFFLLGGIILLIRKIRGGSDS